MTHKPCDMGDICIDCQPRGANGQCPHAPQPEPDALVTSLTVGPDGVVRAGLDRELPLMTPVYTSPPAQHACKWPTCQSEQYQQNLAEQINQELVGRSDQQIVDQTEELAVWLLDWCFGHKPETNTPMRERNHPFAERSWAAACHIQEMLTSTDPENSVAELEEEPITVQQAHDMGAKGGEPTQEERELFEAWMHGHCWLVEGNFDGKTYVHDSERTGYLHPGAMLTRQLWAAWRDRAALSNQKEES